MNDSNLKVRLVTASVLVGVLVLLALLSLTGPAGQWGFTAAAIVAVAVSGIEFARICGDGRLPLRLAAYAVITMAPALLAILLPAVLNSYPFPYDDNAMAVLLFAGISLGAVAAGLYAVFRGREGVESANVAAQELFIGFLLIGIGGAALAGIAAVGAAWRLVAWLLLTVCSNDVAAYFTGKRFEGPKLSPISPKKTVSGATGGLLVGVAIGILCYPLLQLRGGWFWPALILSLLVVIAAQTGDVMKSLVKRSHNVKDSGAILPGHGGVLDRIDGVLMGAVPFLAWVLLFGRQ